MLELLFLLLPVAAAYGWYMGRRSAQQNKQDEANRLSRDYVAGVNFLVLVALFRDFLPLVVLMAHKFVAQATLPPPPAPTKST